ncbi:MAG: hypothetical protein AB1466_05450 [Actinomycetota bacterium]
MGKKSKGKKDKELVCIFLGLELYASPEKAALLKSDIVDLIFSHFKSPSLVGIREYPPVELTPTLTHWLREMEALLKRGR